jgi:hypothetical protein
VQRLFKTEIGIILEEYRPEESRLFILACSGLCLTFADVRVPLDSKRHALAFFQPHVDQAQYRSYRTKDWVDETTKSVYTSGDLWQES